MAYIIMAYMLDPCCVKVPLSSVLKQDSGPKYSCTEFNEETLFVWAAAYSMAGRC